MFCGQCGAKVEGGFSFCPECGKPLPGVGSQVPTSPMGAPPRAGGAPLPSPLDGALRLNPGEGLLRLYRAMYLGDPRKKADEDFGNQSSGVLAITDQRLAFLEEVGMFQKKYVAREIIDLEAVRAIDVGGFMRKSLRVTHLRYNMTFMSGFEGFREVHPHTLKGAAPVPLEQARMALSEAWTRRGRA